MSTTQDLADKLRRGLGNVSIARLSNEQAIDAVTGSITEYSKYRPDQVFDSITTINEQAVYDLSKKDRIINVTEVYYTESLEWEFDKYWPMSIDIGRLAGISLFENPSIWTQYVMRLKQYKAIFDRDFDYNRIAKSLRLIPEPTCIQQVPFIYTRRHTAETVPEEDINDMLLWAKAEANEMMAKARVDQITQVSGYGQSVTIGVSANDLMKDANDLRAQFERRFGGGGVIIVG